MVLACNNYHQGVCQTAIFHSPNYFLIYNWNYTIRRSFPFSPICIKYINMDEWIFYFID